MPAHRLEPLLRPRSVAVLGATERAGTVGRTAVENLLKGGFEGRLFAVNPRYQSVCGVPCFASLSALPDPVEHVIFAVSDARVEAALEEVIAHGARAATIMSSLVLADDRHPPLRERVLARIRAAGLVVCVANGMGFYNFADGEHCAEVTVPSTLPWRGRAEIYDDRAGLLPSTSSRTKR